MPTIKLVVIGASGVGKTSLRGQYISGRFSNGYRATIGADFITKTLPHPSNPDESVTLQIWDTAGQERFSSLSTAFFRGADAALLMFDVNSANTMEGLKKWWGDFRDKAPVADEDMEDFCCVVVGNKIDIEGDNRISIAQALEFLEELVPPSTRPASPETPEDSDGEDPMASSQATIRPPNEVEFPRSESSPPSPSHLHPPSSSIAITTSAVSRSRSPKHSLTKSRSRSSSRFYGTMTTTHTMLSIYHTPSSSLFDVYQSARSSPEPWSSAESVPSTSPPPIVRQRSMTTRSSGSTSSGSAITITPSLFARENAAASSSTALTTPDSDTDAPPASSALPPPPLERGPKLFFTSAKTGEGVSDVFEYIARRVVRKWEYEEQLEARRMHFREASAADTIRLGLQNGSRRNLLMGGGKSWSGCCAT
ncbi:P-loop containing nucleoside triphosphate hydrolase protein [Crucibulum laeve]|uniref:P-loop containing nucleoside triphosphate hydrolase protein n=1 Tax=Crucibulum laeve TaxID=68775 RepID=A0A5C3LIE9_9AGAR|nr:P-loop containing nucleoside triphosphate hydrolase protein [Crucibulum laeve]